jgi:hypothetical protein
MTSFLGGDLDFYGTTRFVFTNVLRREVPPGVAEVPEPIIDFAPPDGTAADDSTPGLSFRGLKF